jgi:hypothetical protein
VTLEHDQAEHIQFCPISKGFSMQDVSSFTLGPVVGHSLNIVNNAFSKCIAIQHIDGSGTFTIENKKFWKKNRKGPVRDIINASSKSMIVDGEIVNKKVWLETHLDLWYDQWKLWHDAIRLSPHGSFQWTTTEPILYCNCIDKPGKRVYMNFVEWKKSSYIAPAYKLFEQNNPVIEFLKQVYFEKKVSIGLVHPKGRDAYMEKALTPDLITRMYNDPDNMACMPYVVSGYLLQVPVYDTVL